MRILLALSVLFGTIWRTTSCLFRSEIDLLTRDNRDAFQACSERSTFLHRRSPRDNSRKVRETTDFEIGVRAYLLALRELRGWWSAKKSRSSTLPGKLVSSRRLSAPAFDNISEM